MRTFLAGLALLLAASGVASAQTTVYDNITNQTLFGVTQEFSADDGGGTDNIQTHLMMDDITLAPGFANGNWAIQDIIWSTINFNAGDTNVRMKLRFFDNDGGGAGFGNPGTFLGGIDFGAIPLGSGANAAQLWIFTLNDPTFFPVPSDGTFWAGVMFDNDNGTSGATATDLDNLGQLTFDPPVVGSSLDLGWFSDDTLGNFTGNNPAGATFDSSVFGGDPIVSFGWSFTVTAVPEPTTWALLGLGACGVVPAYRRWRQGKAKADAASRLFARNA